MTDADKLINAARSKMNLAVARTLNRTAAAVNTQAMRAIGRDLGLQQKDVRVALRVDKARPMDTVPEARVVATGRRIPLIAFAARQIRRGVSYRIGSQGRKTLAGAFIATMKSGHRGVFVRRGKQRLPIDERLGPSIPKSFVNRTVQAAMRAVIGERLMKEMKANVAFYGNKIGISAGVE